ncbi:MAG TPA: GMC family oxidoreductase [Gemmatimonadales bacterium]|nr:GMC family oxidoreductase [Gemmatimonadales bacterium]
MHIDARTLPDGSLLEGDLCIVGAGAAGITVALEWIGSRHKVLLLEGGGLEYEPAMQDLYRGAIVGLPYFPLHAARLHYFGGTTGHWAGFCATLDPIDFEKREWVPSSGWPLRREDLDPFYARAQPLLELGPYEYAADAWRKRDAALTPLPLDPRVMWTKMFQFSPPTRFGKRYRDAIVGARNVHLYTHANVCELEANEPVSAVDGLRVRTLDGKEHRVRARHYVLACCSIQNARLLLASNRRATGGRLGGLGNAHDLVGRFFMEHIEMPGGHFALAASHSQYMKMYALEFGKTRVRGEMALTAAVQREQRILNGTVSLEPGALDEVAKSTFEQFTPKLVAEFRKEESEDTSGSSEGPSPETSRFFHLMTRVEQSPNPDSRVTLSAERDALGMPRVKLDWRLTELERRSFRVMYEVMARELGRSGAGRVQLLDWVRQDEAPWPSNISGGWHHMGTTRMHGDPRSGVVDANCQVHGLDNLHVAGASVYPTGGAANPTLTLVALSLRLSDHLKSKLS